MSIVGYQTKLDEIDSRINSIEKALGEFRNGARPAYQLSSRARKRISEAQKKRWRDYRREKKNA